MRQIIIKSRKEDTEKVITFARQNDGRNILKVPASDHVMIIVYLTNQSVQDFLLQLEKIDHIEFSLLPNEVIPLQSDGLPSSVEDLELKSPIEVYLNGIQSVGSLGGLTGYAITAAIITWIGFYTNTAFLLTAAMIIAPFAGPAMNAAIATAAGNADLLKKSILRYFIAIVTGVGVSAGLSLLFNFEVISPLIREVSKMSEVAILLPLTAGFAGGIHLLQDERHSLVSGTAVGILVAVSLAPFVSLLGIALVIGSWPLIKLSLLIILLQLAGIHLSATIVFRLIGKIKAKSGFLQEGNSKLFYIGILATFLISLTLLWFQLSTDFDFEKGRIETQIMKDLHKKIEQIDEADLIDVAVSFSQVQKNKKVLHIVVKAGADGGNSYEIQSNLERIVKYYLDQKQFQFPVYYEVKVLPNH